MNEKIKIRNERKEDYETVEKMTRAAFYNLYVPGCVEHYLAHIMRKHEDFISELDFVLELDGRIIGNIMYTKAGLVDEAGKRKEVLTFGACLYCTWISENGIWKTPSGTFFSKSCRIRI